MVPQIGTRQSSYLGSYLGSTTCAQTSHSEPVGGVFQKPSKSFSKKLRSLRDRCGRRFRLPGSRKGGLFRAIPCRPRPTSRWMAECLLFGLALSVLTGLLFGLVPALQATRSNLAGSIKKGGRGATAGGLRQRIR